MKRNVSLWWKITLSTTQVAFASRAGVILFTFGKIIRFVFFLLFLFLLTSRTREIAGYSVWQIMMFFITFNLIDTISQFFLRDVYRFRSYIISGSFDYTLAKPVNPLLRSLFGGADVMDLITLIPLVGFLIYAASHLGPISIFSVLLYILLVCNGLMIALSLHIFVLALGVLTTEVDNAIWLFRYMLYFGRIPVEVYQEPWRILLTYLLPVAAMVGIPTHALLGVLSWHGILTAFLFSSLFLLGSYRAWQYALKQYGSASS